MRTKVIVNPMANKGSSARRWPERRARLEAALGPLDAIFTTRPGEATALARAALAEGCRRFVAVGGDGTVNEVMNGLIEDDRVAEGVVLCPIPAGTANELCRALGHLSTPDGAVAAIESGRTRTIDLVRADFAGFDGKPATRYGYLVASYGGAATISHRTSASRWLKKLGRFAYFLMTPVVTMGYRPRHVTVRVDDGAPETRVVFTGMIANTENGGGGMRLAPGALCDDGLLDYVEMGDLGRAEVLLKVLPKLFDGGHVAHPKVSMRRGRAFDFACDVETLVDLDGETVGNLPLRLRILPRALSVPVV